MKLFEDTTIWVELNIGISSDEDFIANFEKIFNYYNNSEYQPEAKMKFYIDLGEIIWIEIKNEGGFNDNFILTIDDKEIDFEENTPESILKAIKDELNSYGILNSITHGTTDGIDLNKQTIFPMAHVYINQGTPVGPSIEWSINIWVLDVEDYNDTNGHPAGDVALRETALLQTMAA